MIDRDIYVCVKQKWNKKKWNIYAVVLNVYCFLSSISLRLLHLIISPDESRGYIGFRSVAPPPPPP